jgi:hypothetical protein
VDEIRQVDITAPLTFDRTYKKVQDRWVGTAVAKTKVKIHLRNTGNSPALKVVPDVKLIVDQLTTEKAERDLCLSIRNEPQPGHDQGFVSFPGPEPIENETPISAEFPPGMGSPIPHFFTIVSCVTYRLPFDDEPHQTGIIFNLTTVKLSAKVSTPSANSDELNDAINDLAIDTRSSPIDPADLRISVWHLGSFAN